MRPIKDVIDKGEPLRRSIHAVSATFKDGGILEAVYDPDAKKSRFAFWREGKWEFRDDVEAGPDSQFVPISANNNLIKTDAVRLPSAPEEYESEE